MAGATRAIDPVCDMEVDPTTAAGSSEYKGITYYFCSAGCKKQFDRNPEQFLDEGHDSHEGHDHGDGGHGVHHDH